jgi:hypothetical protein
MARLGMPGAAAHRLGDSDGRRRDNGWDALANKSPGQPGALESMQNRGGSSLGLVSRPPCRAGATAFEGGLAAEASDKARVDGGSRPTVLHALYGDHSLSIKAA